MKIILSLLARYEVMWSVKLGIIRSTKHRLELNKGCKPVYHQPYRAVPNARATEIEEVDSMLRDGHIEPTMAEWANPVVVVQEKNDPRLRFCVKSRKLNAVAVRDSYPIPGMGECIDSLGDAEVSTILDCNSGYWQITVEEEEKKKKTFTCHSELYRVTRMPFGLRNAPETFQRALDIILSKVKWKAPWVYIDDLAIFSMSI